MTVQLFRSRYEITWTFSLISLRLLSTLQIIFLFFCKIIICLKVLIPAFFPFTGVRPFRAFPWPCYFFTTAYQIFDLKPSCQLRTWVAPILAFHTSATFVRPDCHCATRLSSKKPEVASITHESLSVALYKPIP